MDPSCCEETSDVTSLHLRIASSSKIELGANPEAAPFLNVVDVVVVVILASSSFAIVVSISSRPFPAAFVDLNFANATDETRSVPAVRSGLQRVMRWRAMSDNENVSRTFIAK